MFLRVTVLQYRGAPPLAALAYMFDERGGSIGRENCNLTLPDETRVMSRVQAQIDFANGLFSLIDKGGNPSIVNGLRVGHGQSRILYDGDLLELCDYKLRVKAIGIAAAHHGGETSPMLTADLMPSLDLAPPILLEPEELTSMPDIVLNTGVTEANLAKPFAMEIEGVADINADQDDDAEFDLDFSGLDHPTTVGPLSSRLTAPTPPSPTPVTAAGAKPPTDDATAQDAMLAAFCLGLGLTLPADAGSALPPQHMGVVMRRAMQRAFARVLASYAPNNLVKRLSEHTPLTNSPGADRKDQLWELFEQRHADIANEAEDNFQTLFNAEFLKACEAQLSRLRERT